MSRFLMATLPIGGHVTAGMVIARQLVRRGHEVGWYTGQRFQSKIEAAGIRFFPIQASLDYDDRNPNAFFTGREGLTGLKEMKYMLKHMFADAAPGQVVDIEEVLKDFPADVLVADPLLYGGGWQHERGGPVWAGFGHIPLTITSRDTAPFGLGLLPNSSPLGRLRNHFLTWTGKKMALRNVINHIDKQRTGLGLSAQRKDPGAVTLSPYLFLQGTAPAFEYPRSDLPPQVHFVGPFLPSAPAEFTPPGWWSQLVEKKYPVVHVTQGTMETDPAELILPTIQALADEKVLVVATTGGVPVESLNLPPLPANVRLESFISHHHLLRYTDVMVTNGGYNGVSIALANGVPLVVNGHVADKPEVGRRVEWAGVGINLKDQTPGPAQIRQAVRQILDNPSYRQKARQMQYHFAHYNAGSQAAILLEQLALTQRPVTVGGKVEIFKTVPSWFRATELAGAC